MSKRTPDFPQATGVSTTDLFLLWQNGVQKNVPFGTLKSVLPASLALLSDVSISNPSASDYLTYDGSKWTNTQASFEQRVYIQDTAPVGATPPYTWWQTNYNVSGGLTLWIETGV